MNPRLFIALFLGLSALLFSFTNNQHQKACLKKSLKGTKWNSHFYYYHNFYSFETDSTGYFEDGRIAWSCPLDLEKLNIPENEILYETPIDFKYQVTDSSLILNYKVNHSEKKLDSRSFILHEELDRWVSTYEYAYGKEVLRKGDRIKFILEKKN